jgi:hypothetical protein
MTARKVLNSRILTLATCAVLASGCAGMTPLSSEPDAPQEDRVERTVAQTTSSATAVRYVRVHKPRSFSGGSPSAASRIVWMKRHDL